MPHRPVAAPWRRFGAALGLLALLLATPSLAQVNVDRTGWPLMPVARYGNWGLANHRGEMVRPCELRAVLDYTEGRFMVVDQNLRWGYLDSTGQTVIEPMFFEAAPFEDGRAYAFADEGPMFINRQGERIIGPQEIPPGYEVDAYAGEGLYRLRRQSDGKLAFATRQGPLAFNGLWAETGQYVNGLCRVRTDSLWDFINPKGEVVFPNRFRAIATDFHEGLAAVTPLSMYNLFIYIDPSGRRAFQGDFDEAKRFENGTAPVRTYKNWGVINRQGKFLVPMEFFRVYPADEHGFIRAQAWDYTWALYDTTGRQLVAPGRYRYIGRMKEGYARVQKGVLWGYINNKGKEVIAPQFDDANPFSEEKACVRKDGRWGFINPYGQFVIDPKFREPSNFHNGVAMIVETIGERFSLEYIDQYGQTVWAPDQNR